MIRQQPKYNGEKYFLFSEDIQVSVGVNNMQTYFYFYL